jgi:hypothetical protein
MKRIVMLLVFALVIPRVGFAGDIAADKGLKGLSDQEILDEAQRRVNERKSKQPDTDTFEDSRVKERARKMWEEHVKQTQEENFLKTHQTMRLGGSTGLSISGTKKNSLILGGQVEFPEQLISEFGAGFPNSTVSIRASYTIIGDEWILSEGTTHAISDVNIQSLGLSLILRHYYNAPPKKEGIRDISTTQNDILNSNKGDSDPFMWTGFIAGINYNFFKIDKNIINANISKDFDNSKVGFHLGVGGGIKFKNLFIERPWEIFGEYRYNFVKIGAAEKGIIWGMPLTKEVDENHDYSTFNVGLNVFF